MRYPRDIPDGDDPFYVVSHADWSKNAPWTVVRRRDARVMCQGSVYTVLRWLGTWGPTRC